MTHHIDTAITLVSTTVAGAVGWVSSKWAFIFIADANGYSLNGLGQSLAGTSGVVVFGILAVRFLLKDRDTQTAKLDKLENERNEMTRELMTVVSHNTTAFENIQAQNHQIVQAMERQASAVNNAIASIRK